jgi:hypothetical protein
MWASQHTSGCFYSAFKYLNFWNAKAIQQGRGLRLLDICVVDRYPFALSCSTILDYSELRVEIKFDPKAASMTPTRKLLDLYICALEKMRS